MKICIVANNPHFVAANTRRLPFTKDKFDTVFMADSPRGEHSGLDTGEQLQLFYESAIEAWRVLKPGGLLVATCYPSWTIALNGIFPIIQRGERAGGILNVRCAKQFTLTTPTV